MTEELGAVEEELVDRMFEACEEVEVYARERWGESLDGVLCDAWEEKAVEVGLCDSRLLVDGVDIENVRRMLEKHGLAIKRVVIDIRAGDYIAEVKIRFHVELAASAR